MVGKFPLECSSGIQGWRILDVSTMILGPSHHMTLDEGPIRSEFHDDPQLTGILAAFLDELPDRIKELQNHFDQGRQEPLRRLAHQLKGAGGGYGFQVITVQADALLRLLDQGEEDWAKRSHASLRRLIGTLHRAHDSRPDLPAQDHV